MAIETLDDLFLADGVPNEPFDDELFDLCMKFQKEFHCPVPREMIPQSIADEQLKSAIKLCLQQKSADILRVLGINISMENLY